MSQDAPAGLSRKEKRAQRDAARAEKFKSSGKKRKVSELVENDEEDEAQSKHDVNDGAVASPEHDDETAEHTSIPTNRKRKQSQAAEHNDSTSHTADNTTAAQQPAKKKQRSESTVVPEGKGRQKFVVFCGNLPFSATDDSLKEHFAKLQPFTLRHRTDPATGKSKGFAFVEFENFDRMKTCLKLYHHSFFDPDNPGHGLDGEEILGTKAGKRSKGRRINVELTAGGGGSTDVRKEKIRVKNERLEEQRKRRAEAELKDKVRKEMKGGAGAGGQKPGYRKQPTSTRDEGGASGESVTSNMHPSRLARLNR